MAVNGDTQKSGEVSLAVMEASEHKRVVLGLFSS